MGYTVRQARTADVPGIRALVDANVSSGRLLGKANVTLYEDVQEFWVAEQDSDGLIAGCGALHVLWEDLAEIRTIAVRDDCQGHGLGHQLANVLLDRAREVGVQRVFVLTFEVRFFASLGFTEIFGTPVAPGRVPRTAALLRRGRGRVPRPGLGQAQHPGQHPDAAAPALAHRAGSLAMLTSGASSQEAELPVRRRAPRRFGPAEQARVDRSQKR